MVLHNPFLHSTDLYRVLQKEDKIFCGKMKYIFVPVLVLTLLMVIFLMTFKFGRLLNFRSLFKIKLGLILFRVLVFVFCKSRALLAIFKASILNRSWESEGRSLDSGDCVAALSSLLDADKCC